MICTRCGELFDIKLEDLTTAIKRQLGQDIVSYQLMIRFICPTCRKLKEDDNENQK